MSPRSQAVIAFSQEITPSLSSHGVSSLEQSIYSGESEFIPIYSPGALGFQHQFLQFSFDYGKPSDRPAAETHTELVKPCQASIFTSHPWPFLSHEVFVLILSCGLRAASC